LGETFKIKIKQHYDSTDFAEPDSSRRILSPNGRFFDLLMAAQEIDSAREEIEEIKAMVKEFKLVDI
ncbi:MAG: DNA-binding protein, partial [Desulfobacterium sp.]|nr:DNA-binding protein [Desulfobacterium sp.]